MGHHHQHSQCALQPPIQRSSQKKELSQNIHSIQCVPKNSLPTVFIKHIWWAIFIKTQKSLNTVQGEESVLLVAAGHSQDKEQCTGNFPVIWQTRTVYFRGTTMLRMPNKTAFVLSWTQPYKTACHILTSAAWKADKKAIIQSKVSRHAFARVKLQSGNAGRHY